eukprot:201661_1
MIEIHVSRYSTFPIKMHSIKDHVIEAISVCMDWFSPVIVVRVLLCGDLFLRDIHCMVSSIFVLVLFGFCFEIVPNEDAMQIQQNTKHVATNNDSANMLLV